MASEFVGVVIAVVNKTTTGEGAPTEVYSLQRTHAHAVCFGNAQPHVSLCGLSSLCVCLHVCTLRLPLS